MRFVPREIKVLSITCCVHVELTRRLHGHPEIVKSPPIHDDKEIWSFNHIVILSILHAYHYILVIHRLNIY
jgi:hypothetical protein